MKNRFLMMAAILFFAVFLISGKSISERPLQNRFDQEAQYARQEILVKYKRVMAGQSLQAQVIRSFESRNHLESLEHFAFIDVYLYKCQDETLGAVDRLNGLPEIEYAEPNYIWQALAKIPNDPFFANQWGLNNTGQSGGTANAHIYASEAWDYSTGGAGVVVAVIDTGVDYNHPDLASNMWVNALETPGDGVDNDQNGYVDDVYGINAITNSGNPMDDKGHGTHCAGIIGAAGNNSIGISGVCWTTKLMALKFLNSSGSGTTADSLKCIQYAISKGANIISASWGGTGFSQAQKDAIDSCKNFNIVFVAAAGNDGKNIDDTPFYPVALDCENIISVAATDNRDARASFSNYGKIAVDVAAPGVLIYSTLPNNTYGYLDGTSMAAPFVSGIAALVKSYIPGADWKRIKTSIMGGTTGLSGLSGLVLTSGRVNAKNALLNSSVNSFQLNIGSTPITGANVNVSPLDKNNLGSGSTPFNRTFTPFQKITVTADLNSGGRTFGYWKLEGKKISTDRAYSVSLDFNHVLEAVYGRAFTVNPQSLRFGAGGGFYTQTQRLNIQSLTSGAWTWSITNKPSWLNASALSGSGNSVVDLSLNAASLPGAGSYLVNLRISVPDSVDGYKDYPIYLTVYSGGSSAGPFGSFDTPLAEATVMSSIPVTGWALDDIEVTGVGIFRNPIGNEPTRPNGLVYIGDAVFVEGARPDVETANPNHPLNYRAGWGYMMLTNFLPNSGNGTFVLSAIATDKEGHEILLGPKTIYCNNFAAVKPFGAIDTPTQGGVASGSIFYNFGWVLTPLPKFIPYDGSTIWVWVDGVPLGRPSYGHYRADVAKLFPGYLNSSGAVGVFNLNTANYANGVHDIAWSVTDSAGAADGIGSRFFRIVNTGGGTSLPGEATKILDAMPPNKIASIEQIRCVSADLTSPVYVRRGFDFARSAEPSYPNREGRICVDISELERVSIYLDPTQARETREDLEARGQRLLGNLTPGNRDDLGYAAYIRVGSELRPLPIGATFDQERGVLYWHPGPGFLGDYNFIFVDESRNMKKSITIRVGPKAER